VKRKVDLDSSGKASIVDGENGKGVAVGKRKKKAVPVSTAEGANAAQNGGGSSTIKEEDEEEEEETDQTEEGEIKKAAAKAKRPSLEEKEFVTGTFITIFLIFFLIIK
jgi:hypothetical protein